MHMTWVLSLPAMLSVAVVSAMAIEKRDADFFNVRTKMHKDMSGRRGDPTGKYFHESVFRPHYDGRFADKQLGYRERKAALSNLIQTYLATFSDIGVETWLMHGTLLGWWWNRKILPWDSDSDVQVTEASMHYLATYYNMSVFHYKTPRIPEGRDYMLEVNPHYVNREQTDTLNVIDARWVDTTTGLFIDITTARYNTTHPAGEGMLSCKDGHEYRDSYIFPLRDTFFEGAPAKIPFAYKEVLAAEYQPKALTLQDFEGHHFDENKFEWIPVPTQIDTQVPLPKVLKEAIANSPEPTSKPASKPASKSTTVEKPQGVKKQPEAAPAAQNPAQKQPAPAPQAQASSPPPVARGAAQPQGKASAPPPVSQVNPAIKTVEEKVHAQSTRQDMDMNRQEEKRKAEEAKVVADKQKRQAEEQVALKLAEEKKAQEAAKTRAAEDAKKAPVVGNGKP